MGPPHGSRVLRCPVLTASPGPSVPRLATLHSITRLLSSAFPDACSSADLCLVRRFTGLTWRLGFAVRGSTRGGRTDPRRSALRPWGQSGFPGPASPHGRGSDRSAGSGLLSVSLGVPVSGWLFVVLNALTFTRGWEGHVGGDPLRSKKRNSTKARLCSPHKHTRFSLQTPDGIDLSL